MQRNNAIDIAKGFAIITVVIAHAEMPGMLNRAIYLFHMPLFFMAAGYFFSPRHAEDPWAFIVRRFKGLYVPFVKWSLLFLVLHNLFHKVGILNEVYGNWSNGVTHPYTAQQMGQRFIDIVFAMTGYDEFLCGAFWFFRGLFVASILFLIAYLIIGSIPAMKGRPVAITIAICMIAWGLAIWKVHGRWYIPTIMQGGYRDLMGCFFFGMGFIYRQYENRIGHNIWVALVGLAIVLVCAYYECSGMTLKPKLRDVFTLALTGIAGWFMTYNTAHHLSRMHPVVWRWLAHCGALSLYVFIWHVSAYKVVSLIKIWWYDLDILQIGCHMVIHEHAAHDLFWVLYTIAGVGIPLLGHHLYFNYVKPSLKRIGGFAVKLP